MCTQSSMQDGSPSSQELRAGSDEPPRSSLQSAYPAAFAVAEDAHRRRIGMKVAIADVNEGPLHKLGAELTKAFGEANVLVVPTDVSKLDEVVRLRDRVYEAWGEVSCHWLSRAALVRRARRPWRHRSRCVCLRAACSPHAPCASCWTGRRAHEQCRHWPPEQVLGGD